jgi:hypothetical protein
MKDILNRILPDTLKNTISGITRIMEVHCEEGNPMTKKQLSECISGVIESKMVEVGYDHGIRIEAPKIDSEPDLLLQNTPLEIKTTCTSQWRGGECSKRNSDYLMISYDIKDGEFYWFVLYKFLKKDDWVSNIANNYYATTITLDSMLDGDILIGGKKKALKLWHPTLEKLHDWW